MDLHTVNARITVEHPYGRARHSLKEVVVHFLSGHDRSLRIHQPLSVSAFPLVLPREVQEIVSKASCMSDMQFFAPGSASHVRR